MRNLKRVLSLGLASVMLMGMMVTGAGAANKDFSDAADIDNVEAVDVMVALGILEGTDKGEFLPDSILTREQAAKIICTMLLGPENADKLSTTGVTFSDVAADRWSAPYIAYCVNMGILAGDGTGKFLPEAQLDGASFAKMLLVALGYDAGIEKYVGSEWMVNVATDALAAGIVPQGMVMTEKVSRQDAALMALMTLEADMVKYANKGSAVDLGNGVVIYPSASDAEKIKIDDESKTNYADKDGDGYGYEQFCERYFKDLKKYTDEDDFGRPATQWKKGSTEIGVYAADAELSYTEGVKGGDIYKDLGKPSNATYTYYVNGESVTTITNYYTGFAIASGNDKKIGGNGALVEVFEGTKDNEYVVSVVYTFVGEINDWTEADEDKDIKESVTITAVTEPKNVYESGLGSYSVATKFETAQFSQDDADDNTVVLYTAAWNGSDGYTIKSMVAAESVTGAVTAKKSDTITVGGTAYDIAAINENVADQGLDADKDVVLYLDTYGNAIYTTEPGKTDSIDVVYVTYAYADKDSWGAPVNKFQGVLTDGTTVTGEYEGVDLLKSDGKLDDTKMNKAYEFEMDGDTYVLKSTGSKNGTQVGTLNMGSDYDIDKNDRRLNGTAKNFFAADVKFVYVDGSKGDLKVTVKEGVQTVTAKAGNFGVISKDADGNLVVSTVFVNDTVATASEDLIYVPEQVTNATETKYGPDGKTKLFGYEVYVNGELTTIYKDKEAAVNAGFYTFSVNDTTGAYTLKEASSGVDNTQQIAQEGITLINGEYLVTVGTTVVDFDATDAKVIDTTDDGKVLSMSNLKNKTDKGAVYVGIVFDKDAETVSYIYVK